MNLSQRTQDYTDSEHLSLEQLKAFAHDRLGDGESATVESHLTTCDRCVALLENVPEDAVAVLFRQAQSLARTEAAGAVAPSHALRLVPGYTLLERLGEGGMGVVWKARQDRLNRLVAVKFLRSAGTASAEALARFRREAESVARLHHANIVQIHEIGEHDGEPFLTLEYVGGSLAQKLAAGPLPPRQAAVLVETLARAMHHAHEHGIIHRDLKPANILLDDDGSPKIGDFGLAKQLDEAVANTQTGAILGTPSYMAPEQARSQAGKPDLRLADVYALGAILYETLTGRPPFRGPTVLDTLAQVREQEPVPPRQLQPSVLRDLETICLKCLHKEPRKRYLSAADLADDLRRFLDGRPIRARRAGLLERLLKWMRRRPAWASLGVVSALALATLLGGGLWYQARLHAAVNRADANYRHARQAINQMLDRLAKFQAPGVPQIEILRRDLSKDALTFFQSIAEAELDADPATRFDFAKAYFLLGKLLFGGDQRDAGRESMDHARHLLERLCTEEPANRDYRLELSRCLEKLAVCMDVQGRAEECLHLREQNLEVCQELCRLEPENADCQRSLALAHLNLGCCFDRPDKAEFHWKEAVRIFEELVREHPEKPDDQYRLAVSCSNLAMLYRDAGRITEADAAYRQVEPRLTKLLRENPSRKDWILGMVRTLENWGVMLIKAHRGEEADPLLNRAVAILEKWYLEDPQFSEPQELLLGCLVARMNNSTLRRQREAGDKDWQRALVLSARLKSWTELCVGVRLDAQLGDHAAAAARAEHLATQNDLKSGDLYQLAAAYALASAAARTDSRLSLAEQGRKADAYAADAVALLNKLRSAGYFDKAENLNNLRMDKDLDSLRRRDDFAKLVK